MTEHEAFVIQGKWTTADGIFRFELNYADSNGAKRTVWHETDDFDEASKFLDAARDGKTVRFTFQSGRVSLLPS